VVTHNGSGYLPLSNWKLPKPQKPNLVEAYVIKREHGDTSSFVSAIFLSIPICQHGSITRLNQKPACLPRLETMADFPH
jgi:hypothetical protein